MANIDNAYSVDILAIGDFDDDQVLVAQGGFDPSAGLGFDAPQGSLFLRRDVPSLYLKTGPSDTGWTTVTAGGTDELVKTSISDGSAGYLLDKLVSGPGLTLTESTGANRTLTLTYDGVARIQTIYVGKHGNDGNPGNTPEAPKLTFGAAITAASALTPSASNKISIHCEDAGEYTESFTIPSFVLVKAPNATFVGNVVITDESEFVFQEISAATGDVISKTGTNTGWATGEIVRSTGTANGLVNSSSTSILIVRVRQVYTENGTGVLDLSTGVGHIHMDIEDMYIEGTGTAIDRQSNNGIIVGRVSHILEQGAGVGNGTALDITDGRMNLTVGTIECTTAYSVAGAGKLDLLVNDIVEPTNRTQLAGAAQVNVIQADSLRWQNKSTNFLARRTEFVAINTTAGAVTMQLPSPASSGDSVTFQDALNTFGTNNLTIDAQAGGLIDDGAAGSQTIVLDVSGTAGVLIYNDVEAKWQFSRIQEEVAFSPSNLIYVTKNGSDTVGDGSFSNPYLTVKKGVTEAEAIATVALPTTVKVLDGIYDEVNPITVTNPYVGIQGNSQTETIIQPTVNGQALFDFTANVVGQGNTLSAMRLRGRNNGGTDYETVVNSDLIRVSGDGIYNFNQVDAIDAYHGLDFGNGTIANEQTVLWSNSQVSSNFRGAVGSGTNSRLVGTNLIVVENDLSIQTLDSARVELSSFRIGGPLTPAGIGVSSEDTSTVILNGGVIQRLTQGIEANDTSIVRGFALEMRDNTNDIEQLSATAQIIIDGALSKTKQIILDGALISLNYTDTDTEDYIVGNAEATGTPGKEFRVREADGRIAIGDNATDVNIADGGIGGSRSINLIDTNGNMRIWRYINTAGTDPALEWIKGTATTADGAGDPAGANPGDPAADVGAGLGTVWWDMFLQETDQFVIRRRTGGGGGLDDEKVRIRSDGSEWLGSTLFDNSDQATILNLQTNASAVNYLEIQNRETGFGPEIRAAGTDTNIDIQVVPVGTGTAITPAGYDANIVDRSLITKAYADATYTGGGGGTPGGPVQSVQWNDGGGNFGGEAELTYDDTNDVLTMNGNEGANNVTIHAGTAALDTASQAEAALYIQADGDATFEGIRTKFQRTGAGISGWITNYYDQNAPSIRLTDEDDDAPYISFNTIASGTYDDPEFVSVMGARGAVGARDPAADVGGFQWSIVSNADASTAYSTYNPAMELDQEWLRIPTGATGAVTTPVNGMVRYDTTRNKFEGYENGSWQDLIQPTREVFHAHNGTTTQALTGTFVTAIIGTDVISDTSFSNTLGEVTVNKTGRFKITYDIGTVPAAARGVLEAVLQVNTVNVPGSFAYSYVRDQGGTDWQDGASATVIVDLTSGDVVRAQIRELGGGVSTAANASRLTIEETD